MKFEYSYFFPLNSHVSGNLNNTHDMVCPLKHNYPGLPDLQQFHGKPLVKPVDLPCNWFKACREMQYNNRVPHPHPLKQGSGVVKYQCYWTTITNYLVGFSAVDRKVIAGGTEVLPCVRNWTCFPSKKVLHFV